jgi:hypothetical protein
MTRRIIALTAATLISIAFVACSGKSPAAPTAEPAPSLGVAEGVTRLSPSVAGSYALGFFVSGPNGFQPVSSLPVLSQELILGAHVQSSSGAPAQSGAVAFEYCSYKGLPPNDIMRADEAPSAACASGVARWKSLPATLTVDASGNAYLNFGIVQIPRTVGFRFRYTGRGSGIANAVSAPADFTWV